MKKTTSERLREYMNMYNLRQVDILNKCKPFCEKYGVSLSRSILSHYISGSFEPGQDKLSILAMGLNVSEAWLMGYDVPITNTSQVDTMFSVLSPDDKTLVAKFMELLAQLTDSEKQEVIKHMEFTIYKRKEDNL